MAHRTNCFIMPAPGTIIRTTNFTFAVASRSFNSVNDAAVVGGPYTQFARTFCRLSDGNNNKTKKLCYRRRTARRAMSLEILSTAARRSRNGRNKLHNKSTPNNWTCGQQGLPSTSFVDNTIDIPWRNFLSLEFWTAFQSTFIFVDTQISLQHGQVSTYTENQLDPFIYFDRTQICAR